MPTPRLRALAAAAPLAACATPMTTTLPTPEALAAYDPATEAKIVVNVGGSAECEEAIVAVNRRGERQNTVLQTVRDRREDVSEPAMAIVTPGTYGFNKGVCFKMGYYPLQLTGLPLWSGPVEVAAGETVYLGTLNVDDVTVNTRQNALLAALNAITLSPTKDTHEFVAYEVVEDAGLTRRLDEALPGEGGAMVTRLAPQFVSRADYEAAFLRAYARDANGKLPSEAEAKARLNEELKTVTDDARRAWEANKAAREEAGAAGTATPEPTTQPTPAPGV